MDNWSYRWNNEFLNGVPQFAISIAYEEKGEIKCGVIFNPIMNEMFCAEKEMELF